MEIALTAQRNVARFAGRDASDAVVFGPEGRYLVVAIHTKGTRVRWVLHDSFQPCPRTGLGRVVRAGESASSVLRGL